MHISPSSMEIAHLYNGYSLSAGKGRRQEISEIRITMKLKVNINLYLKFRTFWTFLKIISCTKKCYNCNLKIPFQNTNHAFKRETLATCTDKVYATGINFPSFSTSFAFSFYFLFFSQTNDSIQNLFECIKMRWNCLQSLFFEMNSVWKRTYQATYVL